MCAPDIPKHVIGSNLHEQGTRREDRGTREIWLVDVASAAASLGDGAPVGVIRIEPMTRARRDGTRAASSRRIGERPGQRGLF